MHFLQRILGAGDGARRQDPPGLIGLSFPDLAGVILFLVLAVGVGEFSLSSWVRGDSPTASFGIAAGARPPALAARLPPGTPQTPGAKTVPGREALSLPGGVSQGRIRLETPGEGPAPVLETAARPALKPTPAAPSPVPPEPRPSFPAGEGSPKKVSRAASPVKPFLPSLEQADKSPSRPTPGAPPPSLPKSGSPPPLKESPRQGASPREGAMAPGQISPQRTAGARGETGAPRKLGLPPAPSPDETGLRVARAFTPEAESGRAALREIFPSPGRPPLEGREPAAAPEPQTAAARFPRMRDVLKEVWETFGLNRVRVGREVVQWDPERDVVEMRPWSSPAAPGGERRPAEAAWKGRGRRGEDLRALVALEGEIRGSLYESVIRAGGSGALALALAEVFRAKVDFRTELRPGDAFSLVAEQWLGEDGRQGWGRVLAAELRTQGTVRRAVGYPSRDGTLRYYDPKGDPLQNHFLHSPLDYTRISSGYSLRRFHPILKVHRPHRGIDYAAPAGTAVRAVADGVVAMAGWSGEGGKTVEIRHDARVSTRYHHLSRYARGIRPGRRISKGQVIGYVGSTGLSTGPHLDFRVLRNGRPMNPLALRRVSGEPVPVEARERFFRVRDALFGPLRDALRRLKAEGSGNVFAAKTKSP